MEYPKFNVSHQKDESISALRVNYHFFTQVDNVVVECPFPKSVLNVTLSPNQGKYTFDPTSKVMVWDVGRIDATKTPNIKGTVSYHSQTKIKHTDWLLADMCPQAANHCGLF